jgi:hypothetical protein
MQGNPIRGECLYFTKITTKVCIMNGGYLKLLSTCDCIGNFSILEKGKTSHKDQRSTASPQESLESSHVQSVSQPSAMDI